jgi:hypothetical protein
MALANWVLAAVLLVALMLGVGMVFYSFYASLELLVLALGLTLVGISGAALRDVYPSEESVRSGAVGSVWLLMLYTVALSILGLWKLVELIGVDATAIVAGVTALGVWLKTRARAR